ncbi:hypothetical protein GOBAR_AA00214 [Gossypium barbadense]|uniref:Uncharacterized protein n=1 Tax=Gossypium barbadense TaxID=3634 RepID=A0A2P5YXV2_GOSBA|nr:hypothetical protein GOBAR_AA00214 [Gossypium barbadense]
MVQPTLQEMSLKEVHKPFSSNSKGPIHEERRLQIEELDEWQTHKSRTHDKPKLHQNKLSTFPNQLKVGDKVLLDAADPHIVTAKPNEEIPLTILSIFSFGTVEVYHVVFTRKKAAVPASKKKKGLPSSSSPTAKIRHPFLQCPIGPQEELFQILWARTLETVMARFDNPGTIQFYLGSLVRQLNVPEFGTALGLYTEEFMEDHSKASAFAPSLRYLHTILAHTLTGRRESTGVINTHDTYFLWCMSHGHVIDLAYFIALAIQHQTERHRKVVTSIGSYATQLARYFGLLNTAAQSSSLTLMGQMTPQSISSMLIIKSSSAHHHIGTKNSTEKGSPRLPCPARPRPYLPPDIIFFWCRTYGLMNLYHHWCILLHPYAD